MPNTPAPQPEVLETTAEEILRWRTAAESVPAFEARVSELQAEVGRLTALTALPGSSPPRAPQNRRFQELPREEQQRELLRQAAEQDRLFDEL